MDELNEKIIEKRIHSDVVAKLKALRKLRRNPAHHKRRKRKTTHNNQTTIANSENKNAAPKPIGTYRDRQRSLRDLMKAMNDKLKLNGETGGITNTKAGSHGGGGGPKKLSRRGSVPAFLPSAVHSHKLAGVAQSSDELTEERDALSQSLPAPLPGISGPRIRRRFSEVGNLLSDNALAIGGKTRNANFDFSLESLRLRARRRKGVSATCRDSFIHNNA